jgi:hypothetical protein
MKKRLALELGIYIILPIVLGTVLGKSLIYYAMGVSLLGGIVYTIINKIKNKVYNLSGITILSFLVINMALKVISKTQYDLIINEIYFLITLSILLSASIVFKKSFIMQILKDILEILGHKKTNIDNIFGKNQLDSYFTSFNSLFIVHLLILSFIKMHFILAYGPNGIIKAQSLSSFIGIIFISTEIILSTLIINKVRLALRFSSIINYQNSRVVYFNKYKSTKKAN